MTSAVLVPPAGSILITGSDAGYFPLLRDALMSVLAFPQSSQLTLGVLDFGLEDEHRKWLSSVGITPVRPDVRLDVPADLRGRENLGYLTRPFLNEYFPGYQRYIWLDADAWLQTWDVIDALIAGADTDGLAIAHERERSYRIQPWLIGWTAKHYLLGYGPVAGARLIIRRRRLNNGVFCLSHDAVHWDAWRTAMKAAVDRSGNVLPHDQFALNQVVLLDRLPATLLAPSNNWICDRGVPMWSSERSAFCVPRGSHDVISVMHLAGAAAKRDHFDVRTTDGHTINTSLRYSQRPDRTAG